MPELDVPLKRITRFGQTSRTDNWWLVPLVTFLGLSAFLVYTTWAAFQGKYYAYGNYLSPFYSPEIWGDSPHAWFGPKPGWIPSWLPFSPALVILPFPAGFRLTCYYYRGAYYKAFWADPPGCAVGEPRKTYWGERSFPLILQNIHRYFMYAALVFLVFLTIDAWKGLWFNGKFGVGVGSLLLIANVILLSSYTFGCHSFRHLIGGKKDIMSGNVVRKTCYDCSSWYNKRHMLFAWMSLICVMSCDIYIRLCAMGVITDPRII
jgi:hypothetical protein